MSKLGQSNEELLNGIVSTALTAMEYTARLDAIEDKQEVASYLKPVNDGLKQLNKSFDPELASEVQKALDTLNEQSNNTDYDLPYRDTMKHVYKFGQIGLNQMQTTENELEDAKNAVQQLGESLGSLKGNKSADALKLLDRVGYNKSQVITKAHNTNVSRVKNELDIIAKEAEAMNMIEQMDIDKKREGVQLDAKEFATMYHSRALEDLGFGQPKEPDSPEGKVDYYLPEGTEINIDNIEDVRDIYKNMSEDLKNLAISQLDVLAITEPHLMKAVYMAAASGDRTDETYKDAVDTHLGLATKEDRDIATANVKAFIKNIDDLGLHDKLSGWFKDADKEISDRIKAGETLDPEKVLANTLEAHMDNATDAELHYLNLAVNNVESGDITGLNQNQLKQLDDMASIIAGNNAAHKYLNDRVGEVRTARSKLVTAINKAGIGTLAEENPLVFSLMKAYVDGDQALADELIKINPMTEDMKDLAYRNATGVKKDPVLIAELDKVSDALASEADNIAAFQQRWNTATGRQVNFTEFEANRDALKNISNHWDSMMKGFYTEKDQSSKGLTQLKIPASMKEMTPAVSSRILTDVTRNAQRLLFKGMAGEWFWSGDKFDVIERFGNAYSFSHQDRMQSLLAMADYYTTSDGRGGFIPNTTGGEISEHFSNVNDADLFLSLMAVVKSINKFDPYAFVIKKLD